MLKNEGIGAFYTGLTAGLTRQVVYTGARLGLFDKFTGMAPRPFGAQDLINCRKIGKSWPFHAFLMGSRGEDAWEADELPGERGLRALRRRPGGPDRQPRGPGAHPHAGGQHEAFGGARRLHERLHHHGEAPRR